MNEKAYKKIRVVGCSSESIEKAIEAGLGNSGEQLTGHSWFELVELRGATQDGKITEWQATIDVAQRT